MRTRTLLVPALLAALSLGACTSGDLPEEPTTTQTGDQTSDDEAVTLGTPEPPAANGYLCRYISPAAQRALLDGQDPADPVQVNTADDTDVWSCEGRDGDTGLVRVSILRGDEARDEQRAEITAREGVEEGPAHLGEGYVTPRKVVGLTLCRTPSSTGSSDYEPYVFMAEAIPEGDEDVSKDLLATTTAIARGVDQSVGCSPRMAQQQADDASSTTS